MKVSKHSAMCVLILAACFVFSSVAESAVVNWSEGFAEAVTGTDEHEEKVAAAMKLRQELLHIIENIKVTDNDTVGQRIAANPVLAQKLSYVIENARCITDVDINGNNIQRYRVPLYGISRSVISLVSPKAGTEKPFPFIKGKAVPAFTGLILDCRDLNYLPRLLPVVKNVQGQIIYSAANFDQGTLMSRGMADYTNGEEPNAVKRAGKNPLVIKTVEVSSGAIVLSDSDALRVLTANSMSGFLRGANVVILLHEEAKQ